MGQGGADTLLGGGGRDRLDGGNGADVLNGGAGTDTLRGGQGNDTYIIASKSDRIVEESNAGKDTVQASLNFTLPSNVETLLLTGNAKKGTGNRLDNQLTGNARNNVLKGLAGDDDLLGNDGNDQLLGGDGRDDIQGGLGNDRITGGLGRDTLSGGLGNDRFIFEQLTDAKDLIQDFSPTNDLIVIDREGFNLSLPKGTLPKGRFALGNKAQDNGDRFIYNANTGALFFDPDGRGGVGKTTLANLQPNLNFTHMDVTIV